MVPIFVLISKSNHLHPGEIGRMLAEQATRPKRLSAGLWAVQWLLAITLVGGSVWKLATPIPDLASKMPWMGEVSPTFVRVTAALDILGGLGVLLP